MFRPTLLFNVAKAASLYNTAPHVASRFYSAGAGLSNADIESRVLNILQGFDKVDQSKVGLDAHFVKDLGLDSLDTVEVVMAIEEEFSVEIPDKEADEIKTAKQAIEYIAHRADAH
ncbi:NADH dehydrogenase 1, alpha/beta subcomplex subunit 1 NDUFAB1/ACP [Phycomyces blakesleeanus]|uniref:Acyl carrier protein n=2 Tax=Phycomyces blakesleeanus TaxID=4837 RepID=A0A162N3V8_PHYB8|nr:NADH dehydrogenase 1, alpha/beta subcomplex subunit 1 NDUFAB1/ACP [Phycomyces blakesleeanus NRRL 1555(-)]OAD68258.1 NADH dehydrogenase 1, alpha/beta subcomplex subunit 1 NDUFAB1/ACP [Phycomyces blakesleeanus NRRL 1555(-)]|eukprot:XP_018286298.1 NADH dehydrogenase 1, alpha/beta subcomplex subunit 1 NDUFAB1/ACP [Phycomyces blakesleeanus NRRL 1555(-)]